MKYLNHILSALLALPFLVFGSNYFFNFIPMPPMEGDTGAFMGAIYNSKMLLVIKIMEVVFGAMILLNFKRPLALILIAPIVVGIVLVEICLRKTPGIGIGLLALNAFLLYRYKDNYLPILN